MDQMMDILCIFVASIGKNYIPLLKQIGCVV